MMLPASYSPVPFDPRERGRHAARADGDPRTAVARTQAVLCESGALEGIELASDCTTIVVRRARPTADSAWIGFDAREELAHLGDRYLEVFVPWVTLWG